jgi:hypothetical protein
MATKRPLKYGRFAFPFSDVSYASPSVAMPDLPIRYVARITNPEASARAPRGVNEEAWLLEKGNFAGGREEVGNEDVGNR